MLLKKQTVWLLTMLSLVFVLSVYYFLGDQTNNQTTQDPMGDSEVTAPADNDEEGDTNGDTEGDAAGGAEGEDAQAITEEDSAVVNYITSDETFAALRLDLEDIRSRQRSDLQDQISNTELSAEEISNAKDQLNALNEVKEKELGLETSIKSRKDVDDALVRVTGDKIVVSIVAKDHSAKMANEIYHQVRKEFSDIRNENIAFEFAKNEN